MPKRTASYGEWLGKSLKDPEEAAAYLNQHLIEDGNDAPELFLVALRDLAAAHGITAVADVGAGEAPQPRSKPEIARLIAVIRAIGLQFSVSGPGRKTA